MWMHDYGYATNLKQGLRVLCWRLQRVCP